MTAWGWHSAFPHTQRMKGARQQHRSCHNAQILDAADALRCIIMTTWPKLKGCQCFLSEASEQCSYQWPLCK